MASTMRITVWLDDFGWEAVVVGAADAGESVDSFMSDACRHYLAELARERDPPGRPSLQVPPRNGRRDAEGREILLRLPGRLWRQFEAAAADQDVEVPELVAHASLLWVADQQSGRVAERLWRELAGVDDDAAAPG
jgi:hypothetical protein